LSDALTVLLTIQLVQPWTSRPAHYSLIIKLVMVSLCQLPGNSNLLLALIVVSYGTLQISHNMLSPFHALHAKTR